MSHFPVHVPDAYVPGTYAFAETLLRAGALGALVGGTAALAEHARGLKDGTLTRDQAVRGVLGTAAKTGLATGLGAVVAATLRGGPLLTTTAVIATGAAALYVMDSKGKPAAKAAPESAPTPAA
ncbi:magnetosome protein MamC [Pararhodospirillum photometricum]|nr:magnetosome protein MamC [Pararhodospirillum photometricum]